MSAYQVMTLRHIPQAPVEHLPYHMGQCLSPTMYADAVDRADHSAGYVSVFAGSGIVDEMSVHHALQVVGHLTRAQALTRESLTQKVSEARDHAEQLLELTESMMVGSCRLALSIRMARNEWYCDLTGEEQTCTPGARDLRVQVRNSHTGGVVEMAPGCIGHVAEEIVTWTAIHEIDIEVLSEDQTAIDQARQQAEWLTETEHWLLGPQWWEKERALAPESPYTALFR